ncbi:putative RNA-directed DNA polymerase [Tanacetum coccineum]
MGVSRDLRGIPGFSVPRSLSWRKSLGREENVSFNLVKCYVCPSFIEGGIVRGVGLRVVNSHTGNHREDNFTALETIQKFLGIIGSRSLSSLEGRPSSRIRGLESFFYIENRMVLSEYPELLLKDNKIDKKSFKDTIPHHVQTDPLYNLIATYLVHVRTFPDPILYLVGLKTSWEHSPKKPIIHYRGKEMDFKSFMMEGINGEFHFSPEGGVDNEEQDSPSMFAKNMTDSDNAPSKKDEVILTDHSVAEKAKNQKVGTSSKVAGKRKQAAPESSDVDSDPDIHGKSLSPHVSYCELLQSCNTFVVLDNVMNKRTRELMSTLTKAKAACDAIREMEKEKDKAYSELEAKCNDALQDLDKNPLVLDMRAEIETLHGQVSKLHGEYSRLVLEEKKWINYDQTLATIRSKVEGLETERERLKKSETQLLQEMDELRQDRVTVVANVVPHVAMELVRSDEIGLLVARLVKTILVHCRCLAFEEVAALKDVGMAANQTTNNNSMRSILNTEKLNGSNFLDLYRNLRIVLKNEQNLHHLEEALPEAPPATTTADVCNAYTRRVAEQQEVACLMLVSMTLEIQNNLEDCSAFEILKELKTMFQQQAEQELFETIKAFHACKQEEGQYVSTYMLKMKAYLDQMERLGYPMPLVLGVNLILTSLSKDYDQFMQNYNMHGMGKTIPELHAMLKLAEKSIPKKALAVLAIRQCQIQKPKSQARGKGKKRGKGKRKLAYDPKHKIPPPAKKEHPAKDTKCHHCHNVGHWKRNCPLYLVELKKNKANTSGTSGLGGFWKLNKGALDLYVGNSNSSAVEAIRSFDLILPSGMILVLDNFSKDNVSCLNVIPHDGIFEIDMHNHVSNERSIYTCSNKKSKQNLDSNFLWHCRLGYINKKRIAKLQHDELLKPIDDESFEVCVSCISGKMARKPFTHASERADDLLGIIYSDVCGPFKTMSKEGANYYVTFTDDFSRYGYVYMIKHKHEVFEMFKTFQNKVENQLGKTIKALRSDRGGKYLSQEFLDHLRSRGIISQLTPPYTPQHNGLSERRNQILLDMVRSMMSLTTLLMSFWGYALEFVARILNMVPTYKVNKTPYEIWHKKVPNLSYLKVCGCEALVKRDMPNEHESRSIKCIFVGYPKETMGYYFYYPLENKNFVARYVEFFENSLISQKASGSTIDFDEIQRKDAQPSENTSQHQPEVEHDDVDPQTDVNPVRRSARIPQAHERYGFYIDAEEHKLGDHVKPPNNQAALSDPKSKNWLEAMNAEMQSMKDNQVWNLVDLPPNCKTVGSKWIFKKKTDMDGNIHTYKARLVAKSFTQTNGVKFEESFSPVADIKAIRILIAIASYYDYEIWFVNPKHPRQVCKLQRSIYGLKQASRSRNKIFDEEIKKYGFTQNPDEPCVYKRASGSIIVFLILYVDDILLMGNNIPMLQDVKSCLRKCFAMKDLGEATYIL